VLQQVEGLTGKHFERLYVVGGGSKSTLLNRLTQHATGLELVCGAQESSTLGNFSVQLAALQQMHATGASRDGVSHDEVAFWADVLACPITDAHSMAGIQQSSTA
jgi:rhamnulokinase